MFYERTMRKAGKILSGKEVFRYGLVTGFSENAENYSR